MPHLTKGRSIFSRQKRKHCLVLMPYLTPLTIDMRKKHPFLICYSRHYDLSVKYNLSAEFSVIFHQNTKVTSVLRCYRFV